MDHCILTLFWLREIFNLITGLFGCSPYRYKFQGDEIRLARSCGLNEWSIYIVAGFISVVVFWIVITRFIPLKQRFTFILAGLSGGLTGAYLWLILLGPKLMP